MNTTRTELQFQFSQGRWNLKEFYTYEMKEYGASLSHLHQIIHCWWIKQNKACIVVINYSVILWTLSELQSAGGIEIWNLSWVLPRGHYIMSFCYTSEPLLSEAWYLDFFYPYCLLKTRAQSVSYPFLVIYTFANCQFWNITAEKFGLMRIYFENLLRKLKKKKKGVQMFLGIRKTCFA